MERRFPTSYHCRQFPGPGGVATSPEVHVITALIVLASSVRDACSDQPPIPSRPPFLSLLVTRSRLLSSPPCAKPEITPNRSALSFVCMRTQMSCTRRSWQKKERSSSFPRMIRSWLCPVKNGFLLKMAAFMGLSRERQQKRNF